ncbi:MAG: lysophospholipase [Chloroflexota bacterium]
MDTHEWTWKSADGLDLVARSWTPEAKPKAVVCLVHGLGEHVGRYAHVGVALNERGYALAGFDLRGHGKSKGQRGHTPSFDAFMQDITDFISNVAVLFPGIPRFLFGHSLGGILVLNYVLRRSPTLAGVISTAAGLRTSLEEQKGKVALARILGTLIPGVALPSGLDPKTISRDEHVVQAYIEDPLVHDRITLGFGKIMLAAIPWAFTHAADFPVPLLIMHGSEDLLGYPRGSREFADLVPKDCTFKLWDGLSHELHNEPEKEQVFELITKWLDDQLEKV